MQELMCFSAFLYHYIDSSVFLEVARRGAIAPPKSTTVYYFYACMHTISYLATSIAYMHAGNILLTKLSKCAIYKNCLINAGCDVVMDTTDNYQLQS